MAVADNCPACGEWILQRVPGGVRVKGLFTMVLDSGGLVTACANRACRVTYQVARTATGAYRLAPYTGATTREQLPIRRAS